MTPDIADSTVMATTLPVVVFVKVILPYSWVDSTSTFVVNVRMGSPEGSKPLFPVLL